MSASLQIQQRDTTKRTARLMTNVSFVALHDDTPSYLVHLDFGGHAGQRGTLMIDVLVLLVFHRVSSSPGLFDLSICR